VWSSLFFRRSAHRKSKRKLLIRLDDTVGSAGVDKGFEALCAKVKELLAIFVLLLLSEAVLGLRHLKLAVSLDVDETDAEIGTTYERERSECWLE
jgi:hypothetical protein